MFILPNDKLIDNEAIIDAMLDRNKKIIKYWMDANVGQCQLEAVIIKNIGKMNFIIGKNKRYFKVPKVAEFDRLQWIISFIADIVEYENKKFAQELEVIMQQENPYDNFIKTLEENESQGWIYGWNQWEGDFAFEEMKKWFATLPFEIREEMDIIDDDCPICQAMKEGRTSEEELKDAFREANFKNAVGDIYEQANPDNQKAWK